MAGPTATTPALWLKADAGAYSDAGTTLCNNNDTVQQWNDQSGNGRNATQSTAGNRPTYKTNQRNALPALDFDGTNDYFSSAFTGEPLTIFIVTVLDTTAAYQTYLGDDTSDAVAVGAYYFQIPNAARLLFARCTTGDTTSAADLGALHQNSVTAGTWQIFKGRRDSATTIRALATSFWGADAWISDTSSNSLRPLSGSPTIGAGYYNSSVGDYVNGRIAEILIYDSVLSDSETAQVEYYLWRRWGFGASTQNYLATSFHDPGASNEVLRILESEDGNNWYVRPSYYLPTTGHVTRDPSCYYERNADTLWVAHTNITGFVSACDSFDVCKSTDGGALWTYVATVDCTAITGVIRVWAPEWFLDSLGDGQLHVFFCASTDATNFSFYEIHPTNAAMTTWSSPALVGGLPTTNLIADPYVVRVGSTYYFWWRDQNYHYATYSSSSLTSGYTSHRAADFQGFATSIEGASVILRIDNTWRFYCDKFYGLNYSDQTAGDWTGGGSTTWSALTAVTLVNDSFTVRHGTVIYFPQPPAATNFWQRRWRYQTRRRMS